MSKQQTAVEWLVEWAKENPVVYQKDYDAAIDQAKEMEKKQIIDAVNDSWNMAKHSNFADAQAVQYYNETYK
jgi:hypothetical protein